MGAGGAAGPAEVAGGLLRVSSHSAISATTANGHGNQKAPHPQLSPTSATAASAPTPMSTNERVRSSRLTVALCSSSLGHQQPAGAVQDQAGTAEEDQHHERDPQDEQVDVEVPAEAARDAGDLAVGDRAAQPTEVADLVAGDPRAVVPGEDPAAAGRMVLRAVWWSWHPAWSVGIVRTIGDDPDPGRGDGPGRQGRAGVSPHGPGCSAV